VNGCGQQVSALGLTAIGLVTWKVLQRWRVLPMAVRGWVYVITNKSMPGLIKVGFSLKDPNLRAGELYNTGIPYQYVVEYEVFVYEPFEIEQRVHKDLKDFKEAKEWFRCSVGEAKSAIRRVIGDSEILIETIRGNIESVKGGSKILTEDNRFIAYNNGTVLDKHMNRMWAAKDNGTNINWEEAWCYCRNYQGGGYKDWRMPTLEELAQLHYQFLYYKSDLDVNIHPKNLICLTGNCVWSSSESDGSGACTYDFKNDHDVWVLQTASGFIRTLPVRSNK
jgi:hypothetical protein